MQEIPRVSDQHTEPEGLLHSSSRSLGQHSQERAAEHRERRSRHTPTTSSRKNLEHKQQQTRPNEIVNTFKAVDAEPLNRAAGNCWHYSFPSTPSPLLGAANAHPAISTTSIIATNDTAAQRLAFVPGPTCIRREPRKGQPGDRTNNSRHAKNMREHAREKTCTTSAGLPHAALVNPPPRAPSSNPPQNP